MYVCGLGSTPPGVISTNYLDMPVNNQIQVGLHNSQSITCKFQAGTPGQPLTTPVHSAVARYR